MGNRILVTGGCGMKGSNIVKRIVKKGKEGFFFEKLLRGEIEEFDDGKGKAGHCFGNPFFYNCLFCGK